MVSDLNNNKVNTSDINAVDIINFLDGTNVLLGALSATKYFSVIVVPGGATNTPSNMYTYTAGIVLRRTSDQITVILFGRDNGIATNRYNEGVWTGWKIR